MLSLMLFLAMLVGIDAQNCTIEEALTAMEDRIKPAESTLESNVTFTDTRRNCLATSEIYGLYEQISMSVMYYTDNDSSTIKKARYTYICSKDGWQFWYGNKSETSYFNGTRSDCWDCTDRTENDHHCTC